MTGLYVASNPIALTAQYGLVRTMGDLGSVMTRLSTGLKMNSGKDDPAGLIASELLRAQIAGTTQAIVNTQRANAMISTADGAMAQIGNLLNDIKGLTVEAAQTGTMTQVQLDANQLQVDAALDSIDRIARSTSYAGRKLLDGSLGFETSGLSGDIRNLKINSANFGNAPTIGVDINVTRAADYARLISNGTGVSVDTSLDIIGSLGSATVNIGAGRSNAEIAEAINRSSDSTGVIAYVEGVAQRGSVILSSAGAGNEIIVTANEVGLDAGNYAFRIVQGATNDARIVQEAKNGEMGVVEISLVGGKEVRYNDFANLFNININTPDGAVGFASTTSVTMTRGDANKVVYNTVDSSASSNVVNGKSLMASIDSTNPAARNSDLNGWSVVVNNNIASAAGLEVSDLDSKTVFINTASTDTHIAEALGVALGNTLPVTGGADSPTVLLVGLGITFGAAGNLSNGDRFTFDGGANAGEVTITYKEGATADDILKLLNNAPNVTASLASGVNGSTLVPNVPKGATSVAGGTVLESRFVSGATSQEVIDLINSKLGNMFTAAALTGSSGTGGRVSYMDAAADYGDVNMGNALRFTGMDNGPIVRLTNLGSNGQKVANQQLSLNILHPSESDIKAGVTTPILEIKLATDQQGNSITTAQDIVALFNRLTPEQTLGVSVSQLYPPGVDPNGRVYGTDGCGNPFSYETCPSPINGIVQPTGAPSSCGSPQQGDLLLLGTNQRIVTDNAVAQIRGLGTIIPADGISAPLTPGVGAAGTLFLGFEGTSAMNGVSFGFTRDEAKEGFDADTGTLMIFSARNLGAPLLMVSPAVMPVLHL